MEQAGPSQQLVQLLSWSWLLHCCLLWRNANVNAQHGAVHDVLTQTTVFILHANAVGCSGHSWHARLHITTKRQESQEQDSLLSC